MNLWFEKIPFLNDKIKKRSVVMDRRCVEKRGGGKKNAKGTTGASR